PPVLGDLEAAVLTVLALITDTLIFAAVALPVLGGSKDALAEQAVPLGLQGAVVDGLGLLHLAVAPFTDLVGRGKTDLDRIENGVFHESNPSLISITSSDAKPAVFIRRSQLRPPAGLRRLRGCPPGKRHRQSLRRHP